jgi:hypothetical protein
MIKYLLPLLLTLCLPLSAAHAQGVENRPNLEFTRTGVAETATELIYRVDYSAAFNAATAAALAQIGRRNNLQGTNAQVINALSRNPELFQQASAYLESLPPNAENLRQQGNARATAVFGGLALPGISVRISQNHVRTDFLDQAALIQGLAMETVGIGNFQRRESLAVGFFMGVPAAVYDSGFNVDSIFGMRSFLEERTRDYSPSTAVSLNLPWGGYTSNRVRLELKTPVGTDGAPTVFTIHSLLAGGEQPPDPRKRVFIDLYYTAGLYPLIPPGIQAFRTNFNVDGLFVGLHMHTEKGIGFVYKVQEIKPSRIDAGEVEVPPGFPRMTVEQVAAAMLQRMMRGGPVR